MRELATVVLTSALFLLAAPAKAYGYADPGTGAFLYQAAYAAIIGGVYYFRRFLDRLWGRKK